MEQFISDDSIEIINDFENQLYLSDHKEKLQSSLDIIKDIRYLISTYENPPMSHVAWLYDITHKHITGEEWECNIQTSWCYYCGNIGTRHVHHNIKHCDCDKKNTIPKYRNNFIALVGYDIDPNAIWIANL